MPIKPGKDESQSDWMGRCVPEMTNPDRPQEQAVAACLSIWRDAHPGAKGRASVELIIARTKQLFAKQGAPEPEDDESRDDFIDRCVTELTGDDDTLDDDDAEEMCILAWEQRRAPAMVRKTHAETVNGMEFVLSDETPDRMGEIIEAKGWDLRNYKNNPIALFNHRADFIVGRWSNLNINKQSLRGHLELAPEGTSPRIDEIRRLVEAGILKAVSVGFKPIKSVPMRDDDRSPFAPQRYLKQELVETSLVSIPANPNALAVAKSLNISSATLDLVFAGKGDTGRSTRRGVNGGHAETRKRTTIMSSLSQRIADAQARKVDLIDQLEKHLSTIDDNNVTEEQMKTTSELNARIATTERSLELLTESEKHLAGTTTDDGKGGVTTVVKRDPSSPAVILRRKPDLKPLDYLVRAGVVTYLSRLTHRLPEDICKAYAPYNDEETRAFVDWNIRAATNPALTTVTGWAAELVQTSYADFMALLTAVSIFPRLAAKGLSLNFGRAGRISIPTRSATPTIAGSFVGEGLPIPVRQGAFTAQVLTPKKMAVITTWSREIDEHSVPAIEGLLREAIQQDTAVSLDSVLLDANAATAIRPAGLLSGVAATTATAGGGLTALIGDIKALVGALTSTTKGNVRAPAWLMNPTDVISAGLASAPNTGIFPFQTETDAGRLAKIPIIDSATVPAKTVILIDAADFVSVGAQGPRFEVSDQATLHEEDTSPAAIVGAGSPGVVAAPVRSLWQTDSLALRLILPMNWTIRRAGVVAWTQNVTWS
jgi:HK97 family phage prohead protease/HK97 family phage major capsid protein